MRKLASIQTIKYKKPIPDADAIEVVGVLGWECVSKKQEFNVGDKCVYIEIDSLLPTIPQFEFLRKSCYRPDFDKFRVKTIKLRKTLSQGLALPISLFPELSSFEVGSDVTEVLNIEKYEPPIPTQIAGDVNSFSWCIDKTDETRVQLNDEYKFIEELTGKPYYISLKLDGTSSTFLIDPRNGEYHVCGRNYSYKRSSDHSFWKISENYKIEEKLRAFESEKRYLAFQGEIVGPGIQKNPLNLDKVDLYVFNVVDVQTNTKLCLDEAISVTSNLGINFVPIIERGDSFNYSKDELLDLAKGKYHSTFASAKPNQDREGIVIRSVCGEVSFKAINNDFLLKED